MKHADDHAGSSLWGSLAAALVLAGAAAYAVNRRLIARGKGHAVAHGHPRAPLRPS